MESDTGFNRPSTFGNFRKFWYCFELLLFQKRKGRLWYIGENSHSGPEAVSNVSRFKLKTHGLDFVDGESLPVMIFPGLPLTATFVPILCALQMRPSSAPTQISVPWNGKTPKLWKSYRPRWKARNSRPRTRDGWGFGWLYSLIGICCGRTASIIFAVCFEISL